MSVTVNLRGLKREAEERLQRRVTWDEISQTTGLARTTINRLMNGKNQRVDLSAVDRLCSFFQLPTGPVPFIVYTPDGK